MDAYTKLKEAIKDILINKSKNCTLYANTSTHLNGEFIDFYNSELNYKDLIFESIYNELNLSQFGTSEGDIKTNSPEIINWLIALVKFVKEKDLINEFKAFYNIN